MCFELDCWLEVFFRIGGVRDVGVRGNFGEGIYVDVFKEEGSFMVVLFI